MKNIANTLDRYFKEYSQPNPLNEDLAIRQSDYNIINITETEMVSYSKGYDDGFRKALKMIKSKTNKKEEKNG